MVSNWFDTLEKVQILIYRRPNFLSLDFEYEQYMGTKILRNLFSEQATVGADTSILLTFPERWLNVVECHQLFPRLQKYYPNLKKLFIKTHSPLIVTNVPSKYACLLHEENEIVSTSGGHGEVDEPTSTEDPCAIFEGISKGKIFCSSSKDETGLNNETIQK